MIEPALTAEEWDELPEPNRAAFVDLLSGMTLGDEAKVIAIMNRNLADDDPRKITRKRLLAVQKGIDIWFSELARTGDPEDREPHYAVIKFLAALASYLPPAE